MCTVAAAGLAFSVASTAYAANEQQQQQQFAYDQAKANTDRANEANAVNFKQAIQDLAFQQIEAEKAESSQLNENHLAALKGQSLANVQADASGATGNSIDALLSSVNSSYANHESIIKQGFATQYSQFERERKATHTAAKFGQRRENFMFGHNKTAAALKIAGAGIQGYAKGRDQGNKYGFLPAEDK